MADPPSRSLPNHAQIMRRCSFLFVICAMRIGKPCNFLCARGKGAGFPLGTELDANNYDFLRIRDTTGYPIHRDVSSSDNSWIRKSTSFLIGIPNKLVYICMTFDNFNSYIDYGLSRKMMIDQCKLMSRYDKNTVLTALQLAVVAKDVLQLAVVAKDVLQLAVVAKDVLQLAVVAKDVPYCRRLSWCIWRGLAARGRECCLENFSIGRRA